MIKLISITQPLIPGVSTPMELVAYCARVSAPHNQHNMATAPKLVDYLIRNKHWSPLEMVDITLEVTTTRDIARQLLRHRSFSFQEFSQRYADAPVEFTLREARAQDPTNRQNSIAGMPPEVEAQWLEAQMHIEKIVATYYKWARGKGVAKEVARSILPEGMTQSRLYMKGSLRSWIHYVEVRTHPSTQLEHRLLAEEIKNVIGAGLQSEITIWGTQNTPPSNPPGGNAG